MSKPGYELTAAARLDLLQIWNYLAERASLDVADHVLGNIETGFEHLVEFPGAGHRRTDLTKLQLLFYTVHSYLIVYRPQTEPLQVVRVLHGARDVSGILED